MTTSASVTRDDLPVTVSFTRRADPAHAREMTAWIRAGLSMAESFPGFLGAGWVRSRRDADEGTCSPGSPTTRPSPRGRPRPSGSGGCARRRAWPR